MKSIPFGPRGLFTPKLLALAQHQQESDTACWLFENHEQVFPEQLAHD